MKPGEEHLVCKLNKSIYGLKQSPRCWNITLDEQLKRMGFTQSTADPCIYTSVNGDVCHIGVYVDDIVIGGESTAKIEKIKRELNSKFDVKDLGKLTYFLGMKVEQDLEEHQTWIGQPAFIERLLKEFKMDESKPVVTPADPSQKLLQTSDDEECVDQQQYQSLVGSLLYLSVCTRPDITFAVSTLAKFSAKPAQRHWTAAKRVLRYLRGTTQYGIIYRKEEEPGLIGFSDADWAGDQNDRKSTLGYIFQVGSGAIYWKSKKQDCVALSTAEAEYVALSSATQESVWLRRLFADLGIPPEGPTVINEDNQSTIAMTKNPQYHGRAKHIDIKHHFIKEQVSEGAIVLKYCPSEEMTADILTKSLSKEPFCKLRSIAGVVKAPGLV